MASNTYGYVPETGERFDRNVRWTRRLGDLLGSSCEIVEEGMNGRTTAFQNGIETCCSGTDYIIPCLISHSPLDLLIIMLGANDTKSRYSINEQEICMGMEVLLRKILGHYQFDDKVPQILLVSPVPLGDIQDAVTFDDSSRKKSMFLKRGYADLASRYGCRFFDAGSVVQNLGCDGIHFTPEAHRQLAEGLFPIVREILG